jgi:acetyltransferase
MSIFQFKWGPFFMSLEKFFNPKSVAVVGAARERGKVGYEVLLNLIRGGYAGKVFPVNPNAETLHGLKCYPDLLSMGEAADLVIVIVPAANVPTILRQCAKIGTKSVIIVTAGFREVGQEGRELERQVIQIAERAGIRILGPNSGCGENGLYLPVGGIARGHSRYSEVDRYWFQQAGKHRKQGGYR